MNRKSCSTRNEQEYRRHGAVVSAPKTPSSRCTLACAHDEILLFFVRCPLQVDLREVHPREEDAPVGAEHAQGARPQRRRRPLRAVRKKSAGSLCLECNSFRVSLAWLGKSSYLFIHFPFTRGEKEHHCVLCAWKNVLLCTVRSKAVDAGTVFLLRVLAIVRHGPSLLFRSRSPLWRGALKRGSREEEKLA